MFCPNCGTKNIENKKDTLMSMGVFFAVTVA